MQCYLIYEVCLPLEIFFFLILWQKYESVQPMRAWLTCRDVLVACSAGIVDTTHVAPVPSFRQLSCIESFLFIRARVGPDNRKPYNSLDTSIYPFVPWPSGSSGYHQLPPFLSVFHSPLWLWKVQSCPLSGTGFSHSFLCLPFLLSPLTVPCKMVIARPDNRQTWQGFR